MGGGEENKILGRNESEPALLRTSLLIDKTCKQFDHDGNRKKRWRAPPCILLLVSALNGFYIFDQGGHWSFGGKRRKGWCMNGTKDGSNNYAGHT